jgi:hypothetical protein
MKSFFFPKRVTFDEENYRRKHERAVARDESGDTSGLAS